MSTRCVRERSATRMALADEALQPVRLGRMRCRLERGELALEVLLQLDRERANVRGRVETAAWTHAIRERQLGNVADGPSLAEEMRVRLDDHRVHGHLRALRQRTHGLRERA